MNYYMNQDPVYLLAACLAHLHFARQSGNTSS